MAHAFARSTSLAVLIVAALAAATATTGRADTIGFALPMTCVSSPGGTGQQIWQNPERAQSSTDGQARAATGTLPASGVSDFLKCTNFGFAVPHGSTIDAIVMDTSHRRSACGQSIADGHVYPVRSDDAPIGTVGADRRRACGPATNDWTTTFNTIVYADSANPTWGVVWGACAAGSTTCTTPPGSYNVNHPNFGVAIAAQACTGSCAAWVDYARVQLTYTVPACGGASWGPVTVTASNRVPGTTANYLIGTRVPNTAGCALTTGSTVTITFPSDTGTAGTSVTVNGVQTTATASGQTLTFPVPAGALAPCGSGTCIHKDQVVVIAVNGLTNPTTDGDYTLSLSAAPTLNGATGTTTSAPYAISTPCEPSGPSASQWGPISVTLDDARQSIADCPAFTRYTIATTVPSPGGCRLVANQSELVVTLPPAPAGSDVARVTATVNGTAVTPDLTGGALVARLRAPADVGNGQPLTIILDLVKNPEATTPTPTLTLRAMSTRDGSTAETPSAPYVIAAASGCTPALDFFVRDWTTDATAHDVGNSPSAGPNWALTSDVWNQFTNTPPTPVDDWVVGTNPTKGLTNFAFTRISLKTAGSPPAYDRTVTARFYAAPFGSSPNFGLLGQAAVALDSNAPPTFVQVAWPTAPAPDPFAGILDGTHLCLAVEIASPSDPLTSPTIDGSSPNQASKNFIEADNNQAQRNLTYVVPPAPPFPAPPPMGGAGGRMSHFAMVHNGGVATRDLAFRFEAGAETLRHFDDPRVEVVGGDGMPYEAGRTLVLPDVRPGEQRWISFSYALRPGAEGALLPVGFSEMRGEERVSGFAFGIRPSPLRTVIPENLRLHAAVFRRLAAAAGGGAGELENAAAASLLRGEGPSEEAYVAFLAKRRRSIGAAVASLAKDAHREKAVGISAALDTFGEAVGSGDPHAAATAHLALLEKLDAIQTMRQVAAGNPLDVRQMVRWQRHLYATLPRLQKAGVPVVERSDAFLDAAGDTTIDGKRYRALIANVLKLFRGSADAIRADGIDVEPALGRLERALASAGVAGLQTAHREYLTLLDGSAGRSRAGDADRTPERRSAP